MLRACCAACLAIAWTTAAIGAEYDLTPESRLTYRVHHPMHDVAATSSDVKLLKKPMFDPTKPEDVSGIKDIPLQASWASFDSGNANRDSNTRLVVKASQFPAITYVIERLRDEHTLAGTLYRGVVEGRLYVAGQKQSVTASVEIESAAPERIVVRTRSEFKMSGFGIAPPSLLLIAADDVVKIEADLIFTPVKP